MLQGLALVYTASNTRLSISSYDIGIFDCYFLRTVNYVGSGGIMSVTSTNYHLQLGDSMFINCSSSEGCGAIMFSSTSSIINRVCAHGCFTGLSQYYQFGFFQSISTNYNNITMLSVSKCAPNNDVIRHFSFSLSSGIQSIISTNSSNNRGYYYTGIHVIGSNSFLGRFCTITKNDSDESISLCVASGVNSNILELSNNVGNIQRLYSYGNTYSYGGKNQFISCIFYNNDFCLFYVPSGSLELISCIISHQTNLLFQGTLTAVTNNLITASSNIISLSIAHYSTALCQNAPIFVSTQSKIKNNHILIPVLLLILVA